MKKLNLSKLFFDRCMDKSGVDTVAIKIPGLKLRAEIFKTRVNLKIFLKYEWVKVGKLK